LIFFRALRKPLNPDEISDQILKNTLLWGGTRVSNSGPYT
jgi:hypothetical protein